MNRSTFYLALLFAFLVALSVNAENPTDPDFFCDYEPNPLLEHVISPQGTAKVLWVMCAADSEAIRPLEKSLARYYLD